MLFEQNIASNVTRNQESKQRRTKKDLDSPQTIKANNKIPYVGT